MHSYKSDSSMAHDSQQNDYDNQPSELLKIDGIYNHIFLLLQCVLPPTIIYYPLLSTYDLLTTLLRAICCPTASSNTLYWVKCITCLELDHKSTVPYNFSHSSKRSQRKTFLFLRDSLTLNLLAPTTVGARINP